MGLCVLGACSKAPAQAWIVEDLNLLLVLYPLVTFKFVSVVDGSCRRGVWSVAIAAIYCPWGTAECQLDSDYLGRVMFCFVFFFCLSFVRKVWEVTGRWPALASPLVVWGSCLSGFVWCRCDCRDLEEVGLVWGVSGKTEGCWIWRCWGIRSQV